MILKCTLLLFILALFAGVASAATEQSAEFNTRFELARSLKESILVLGKARVSDNEVRAPWRLYFEGFVEHDAADQAAAKRTENTGTIQELFGELQNGAFTLRVGRQALRWSDSWALPSLDVFSGRRWNRFFVDPFSEQLSHPAGLLTSFSIPDFDVSFFWIMDPATSTFPAPFSKTVHSESQEFGLRLKTRFSGLDFAVMAATMGDHRSLLGANLSYAWNYVVGRLEAGITNQVDKFVTVGSDFSPELEPLGLSESTLNFMPQLTWYENKSFFLLRPNGTLLYAPLRLSYQAHSLEVSLYREIGESAPDTWSAVSYKYAASKINADFTGYYQQYGGRPGSLFKVYEDILGGWTVGVRADFHIGFIDG